MNRALVIHAAGDLRLEEWPARDAPGAADTAKGPGPGKVLVRIAVGGICGSDLHYFNHGGFGAVRLRKPMVLGHEVAGHVEATGDGVGGLSVGDLVAISPSRPCGKCRFCTQGMRNQCLNMRFYGSAMPFPHIQGAFRERIVAAEAQCVPAAGLTAGQAAMAEPLSVCLHAVRRAGEMLGRRVLITGCGPIGCLMVMAARRAGAAEIVVTDLAASALAHAERAGADRAIAVGDEARGGQDALAGYASDKGYFDVMFECSGAASALAAGVGAVRPRGVIVQLGLGGDMVVPLQALTAKELDLRGAFRFHEEFSSAVGMMQSGLIDPGALISDTKPLSAAEAAFRKANDRTAAMKVHLSFT